MNFNPKSKKFSKGKGFCIVMTLIRCDMDLLKIYFEFKIANPDSGRSQSCKNEHDFKLNKSKRLLILTQVDGYSINNCHLEIKKI
jgi:hypothetical protein